MFHYEWQIAPEAPHLTDFEHNSTTAGQNLISLCKMAINMCTLANDISSVQILQCCPYSEFEVFLHFAIAKDIHYLCEITTYKLSVHNADILNTKYQMNRLP